MPGRALDKSKPLITAEGSAGPHRVVRRGSRGGLETVASARFPFIFSSVQRAVNLSDYCGLSVHAATRDINSQTSRYFIGESRYLRYATCFIFTAFCRERCSRGTVKRFPRVCEVRARARALKMRGRNLKIKKKSQPVLWMNVIDERKYVGGRGLKEPKYGWTERYSLGRIILVEFGGLFKQPSNESSLHLGL